jgi:pseudouridine-5'-phosphate glycosidase
VPVTVARVIAAVGLGGASVLHGVWAAGSAWPARSRRDLAQAVAGSDTAPGTVPTTVIAVGLAGAAVLVAGAFGDRRVVVWTRRVVGAGLLARA